MFADALRRMVIADIPDEFVVEFLLLFDTLSLVHLDHRAGRVAHHAFPAVLVGEQLAVLLLLPLAQLHLERFERGWDRVVRHKAIIGGISAKTWVSHGRHALSGSARQGFSF